jgi:hypothetical protein
MSALVPKATEWMRHSETSRCANCDLTRRSKEAPLFDHLVGKQQERLWNSCKRWRGFGGGSGAADGVNAAALGADASQQPLLTTPQHV